MAFGNPSKSTPVSPADAPAEVASVTWDRFERFVGQFTHDVRNGLNALELQLTFLGEISTDPEAIEEVKRLRGTLGDVTRQLQAVKTLTGPVHPNVLEYPAGDLFEDLRERLARLQPAAADRVVWSLADDPAVSLLVDPDLTIGGLIELFTNSISFAGSSLQCTTANGAEAVSFMLCETPAVVPAVPTDQWGRTPLLSSRRGAYGLGLFRVHRIMEAQGGSLRATYAADENVLTTTVTVATDSPGWCALTGMIPQNLAMTTKDLWKVLIIDDERPILMTLEALLTRHGYQVEAARTAALGLELAERSGGPDLILLDIGLPDASGLEVLTKVKQSSRLSRSSC